MSNSCFCGRFDLTDRGFLFGPDGMHAPLQCPEMGAKIVHDTEKAARQIEEARERLAALPIPNPKDALGSLKLPLSLVPQTAIAECSLALLEGALKYGRWNWRPPGPPIRVSVYLDACRRHLAKFESGVETDPDSGRPHLAHAMATLVILIDAIACGHFIDDRPPDAVDLEALFVELTPEVARLIEKHKEKHPHHYTIEDKP